MTTARRRPRKLSQAFIDSSPPPGVYSDGLGGNGLQLRVKATAAANFTQRLKQTNGRYTNLGLGATWQIDLETAREQARKHRTLAAQGRTVLTQITVADALERLNRPAPWMKTVANHFGPLLSRPVGTVTRPQVIEAIQPSWTNNPPTAKRARQRLAHVFNWAIAQGLRTDNPADAAIIAGLPKVAHRTTHHETVPAAEIPALLRRANDRASNESPIACLTWQVLTATRPSEAIRTQWTHIDLDAATWTIPASEYKTRQDHSIPLAPQAIAILKRMQGNDPSFVFGSGRGKPPGKETTRKLLAMVHTSATPHGFRTSFRSWAMENDIGRDLAETALGHVIPGVEGAYARSRMIEQRRPIMNQWAEVVTA